MNIIIRRIGRISKIYFIGIRLTDPEVKDYCRENKYRLLNKEIWQDKTILTVYKL